MKAFMKSPIFIRIIALFSIIPNFVLATNQTTTFYHISIPPEAGLDDLSNHLNIIKNQLQYKERYPEAPLYFTSIGKEIKDIPNCINCKQLGHKSTGNEILTLSKLHDYCIKHPDRNVAYIHNEPSVRNEILSKSMRRMGTKSVFSDECFMLKTPRTRSNDEKCQCNVCSSRFSPLPHYHTSGNMWVSSCEYVSKLVKPESIAAKMDDLVFKAPIDRVGDPAGILAPWVGRREW